MNQLTQGRARLFWLTYSQHVWGALAGIVLVFCLGIVGHYDYQDQLELERLKAERSAQHLRNCEAIRKTSTGPKTIFLIEAGSPQEANEKLAVIAGSLDVARSTMK